MSYSEVDKIHAADDTLPRPDSEGADPALIGAGVRAAFPWANSEELARAGSWLRCFFRLDDYLELRPGAHESLFAAIESSDVSALDPLGQSIAAGTRSLIQISPESFLVEVRRLATAYLFEQRARVGTWPDFSVADYLRLRVISSGIPSFFALLAVNAPRPVIDTAALAVGLCNDLATVERERAAGEPLNLVLLLEQRGYSEGDARRHTRDLERRLTQWLTDHPNGSVALQLVEGHRQWARHTSRYDASLNTQPGRHIPNGSDRRYV